MAEFNSNQLTINEA